MTLALWIAVPLLFFFIWVICHDGATTITSETVEPTPDDPAFHEPDTATEAVSER